MKLLKLIDLVRSAGHYHGQALVPAADASELLAQHNTGNRLIMRPSVDYLLSQIKSGEWQDDHPAPIVFSDAGRLIDGQHRLLAISKGGRDVVVTAAIGVRDSLRKYIDTGRPRRLGDRVAFVEDLALNKAISELINTAFWLQNINSNRNRPTPDEAIAYFNAHSAALTFAGERKSSKRKGVTSAPALCALMEMHEKDTGAAALFAADMLSPDGVIQQARRLREYLLTSSSGRHVFERYRKSVFCMKAYIDGKHVSKIFAGSW